MKIISCRGGKMLMKTLNKNLLALVIGIVALGLFVGKADAGDSGINWSKKIDDGSKRFKVLSEFNNEAVLDKETQLVWEKEPGGAEADWYWARGNWCDTDIGGRRGWRLPSRHELASLADPSKGNGVLALPDGHPFSTAQTGKYWSATSDASDSTKAWTVAFDDGGDTDPWPKIDEYYAWCVRAGGPLSEY
jgi:hypothetical protein